MGWGDHLCFSLYWNVPQYLIELKTGYIFFVIKAEWVCPFRSLSGRMAKLYICVFVCVYVCVEGGGIKPLEQVLQIMF